MYNEVNDSNVKDNIKMNNNIASINATLIHVASGPLLPPRPEKHRLLIRHYPISDDDAQFGEVNDEILIEVLASGLQSPEDLTQYGHIEIELKPEILEAWTRGGMQSENLTFIAPNIVRVTSATAKLKNLKLTIGDKFPINVMFNQTKELHVPVDFELTLLTENGCNVGGELYKLVPANDDIVKRSIGNVVSNTMVLSPNPVVDVLLINTEGGVGIQSFQIYGLDGSMIAKENYKESQVSLQVNTRAFEKGLYIISAVKANGDVEVQKFIKN
jgi:hypothetical protein